MPQLSNSPQDSTLLKVEQRKSFKLGLQLLDGNGNRIDVTGGAASLVTAQVNQYGDPTVLFTKSAVITTPASGYLEFLIQAADLDLSPRKYYAYSVVLVVGGFSNVLIKGDLEIEPNSETASTGSTYTTGPAQALVATLRQSDVSVTLGSALPLNVARVPGGGTTGQALVKASATSYDLVWATLVGGLSGAGQTVGKAPVTDGAGAWAWADVATQLELNSAITSLQTYANAAAAAAQTAAATDATTKANAAQAAAIAAAATDATSKANAAQAAAIAAAATDATTKANNAVTSAATAAAVLYYNKTAMDAGQMDTRYYTETEIDNLINGMLRVIPSSVSATGSGNSISFNSTTGKISFSSATTCSVNGVFTSTFLFYLLIWQIDSASADAAFNIYFRASGVDDTSGYAGSYFESINGSALTFVNSTTEARSGRMAAGGASGELKFFGPARSAQVTRTRGGSIDNSGTMSTAGHRFNTAKTHDGFTMFGGTGMNGTLEVYGIKG